MFEFRKNLESPKSKKRLSEWELSLHSSSLRVELIADVESSTNQPEGAGITKVRPGDGMTPRRRKAIAMSSNAGLQDQTGIVSRNPKMGAAASLRQYTVAVAASKVQGSYV